MTSPTTGRSRRALVTGATGYVGSQVAAALLDDGWAVRALSRSRAKAETKDYTDAIIAEGKTAGAVALGAAAETTLESRSGAAPSWLRLGARAALGFDLAWQTSLVIGDLVEKDAKNLLPRYASLAALAVGLKTARPLLQEPSRPRWLRRASAAAVALGMGELVRVTHAHRVQRGVLLAPVAVAAAGDLVRVWAGKR